MKCGACAHRAYRMAHVLADRLKHRHGPELPVPLLHRLYATKAPHGGRASVGGAHTGASMVLSEHLQMKTHFIIQFAIQPISDE
jgi:hypothetical protein